MSYDMKKMKLSNWQYFDCNKNRDLVESFLEDSWTVSLDTLQFVTDYWWIDNWVNAIIDYYDLDEDFEDYLKDNRDDYILDYDEDE